MAGLFERVGVREIKELFTQTRGDKGQITWLLMKSLNDKQKQSEEMSDFSSLSKRGQRIVKK